MGGCVDGCVGVWVVGSRLTYVPAVTVLYRPRYRSSGRTTTITTIINVSINIDVYHIISYNT